MSISSTIDANGIMTLTLSGRFDFSSLDDFTRAYQQPHKSVVAYVLDMTRVMFIDSSALGMLLVMRDHAGGDRARIRIINCSQDVRRSLMSFDTLFEIRAVGD